MLQSTAAASQGRPLWKIAGEKAKKVPGNLRNNGQFRRPGFGDTWGVIRSRPLNWDIYIVIELSTK